MASNGCLYPESPGQWTRNSCCVSEYLAAENRILKAQLKTPLRLTDAERMTLAEIAHRLGRKALEDVANTAKPDTIMGWYRRLVARKFDGSKSRRYPGRPRIDEWGFLERCRYLIHDRDTKFTDSFRAIVRSGQVEPLKLPARSPNLNAYAERWVKSVKEEALSKLILFGEASLRHVLSEYLVHFHRERNHQGKGNVLLFPLNRQSAPSSDRSVRCRERLGGLLKYYHREAA